jgi:Zn finger protein HypA/HybF involved in hydrogenase expression
MPENLKLPDARCPRCDSTDVEIYDRKQITFKLPSGGTAVAGYKAKCQCRGCGEYFRTELLYGPS